MWTFIALTKIPVVVHEHLVAVASKELDSHHLASLKAIEDWTDLFDKR